MQFTGAKNGTTPYRVDLLQKIHAYQRCARSKDELEEGQLVYYGPQPSYYGIGEVVHVAGRFISVDFRGTGLFDVHQEVFEPQYLIPIPSASYEKL